ncbi:hypothetical protein IWX91DRAFT_395654, partial [Phyllosticta citricarpa]
SRDNHDLVQPLRHIRHNLLEVGRGEPRQLDGPGLLETRLHLVGHPFRGRRPVRFDGHLRQEQEVEREVDVPIHRALVMIDVASTSLEVLSVVALVVGEALPVGVLADDWLAEVNGNRVVDVATPGLFDLVRPRLPPFLLGQAHRRVVLPGRRKVAFLGPIWFVLLHDLDPVDPRRLLVGQAELVVTAELLYRTRTPHDFRRQLLGHQNIRQDQARHSRVVSPREAILDGLFEALENGTLAALGRVAGIERFQRAHESKSAVRDWLLLVMTVERVFEVDDVLSRSRRAEMGVLRLAEDVVLELDGPFAGGGLTGHVGERNIRGA